jgi:hypothetical protein
MMGTGMTGAGMMGTGLTGTAPGQQVGPPPLPSAALFHIELNGAAAGPFPLEHLRGYATSGQLAPTTLVWTAGMAGWAPAQTVPAVAALFPSTPPPLPPTGG